MPDRRPIVVVAEDDAIIRQAAAEMIESEGYAVLEAVDGSQAMRLLETVPGIRAVMTDIDMPSGISGINLTACIRARWPTIGVIVVSGKVVPVPGDIPDHELCYFFAKPYSPDVILDTLLHIIAVTDGPSASERSDPA